MIKLELEGYTERDIIERVVEGISHDILSQNSGFDKFKNQIAESVAKMIHQDMINSGEVERRINLACEKAEKAIDRFNNSISKAQCSDKDEVVYNYDVFQEFLNQNIPYRYHLSVILKYDERSYDDIYRDMYNDMDEKDRCKYESIYTNFGDFKKSRL